MASASERYALLAIYEAAGRTHGRPVDFFSVAQRAGYPADEAERVLGVLAAQRLLVLTDLGNQAVLTEAGGEAAREMLRDRLDESGVRDGIAIAPQRKSG